MLLKLNVVKSFYDRKDVKFEQKLLFNDPAIRRLFILSSIDIHQKLKSFYAHSFDTSDSEKNI